MRKIKTKKVKCTKNETLEFNRNFVDNVINGSMNTLSTRVVFEILVVCFVMIGGVALCL